MREFSLLRSVVRQPLLTTVIRRHRGPTRLSSLRKVSRYCQPEKHNTAGFLSAFHSKIRTGHCWSAGQYQYLLEATQSGHDRYVLHPTANNKKKKGNYFNQSFYRKMLCYAQHECVQLKRALYIYPRANGCKCVKDLSSLIPKADGRRFG